jgi:predicted short-subunit dehydrogenase-like oxidoreductase (DUF2520 family)
LQKKTNIVILGTGNLATHLANFISQQPDLKLIQLFNHRKTKEALSLAKKNNCSLVSNYTNIITHADIYFICVKDDSIKIVSENLKKLDLQNLVVHTSGSVDLKVLNKVSNHIGVFYPLQTFSKEDLIDWKTTPLLLESNNSTTFKKLQAFSKLCSTQVKKVDSKTRLKIHLAAVFGCNFTNALFAASYQLIEKALSKKEIKLIHPILQQSFHKMLTMGPLNSQTGPAKRNDKVTMQKHLELLKSNKKLTSIYKIVSDLIQTQQHVKL